MVGTRAQRVELEPVERAPETLAHRPGAQSLGEPVQVAAHVARNRLAREVPDDCAQLPLRVKRESVVDPENPSAQLLVNRDPATALIG